MARLRALWHPRQYLKEYARPDLVAGLTVAVMGVPQAMAYAMIADLPPVYGLYTAIITCAVGGLLGSSSHLVIGPTNATCMIILSLMTHLKGRYELDPFEIVLLLTFLTGCIQLSFGLLRMGGVIRYVSNSVVVGFTAGAGILIIGNQLRNILGFDLSGEQTESFQQVLRATARHLPETNPYALTVGLLTAVLIIVLPKLDRRLPAALLGVLVSGALAYLMGWHSPEMGAHRIEIVSDIGPISASLIDSFRLPAFVTHPNFELARDLGTGALSVAILGLIEAASIARTVAAASRQRVDFNRQFSSQGAANMVGSFFSCFAGSGSFTRTAVCFNSGGKTRMASIFSAGFTALTVLLLAPVANYIPKASLAGLLIVVAYSMIEKHRVRLAYRSGANSRIVLFGTLASTLLLPLEYATFVGVFLSVLILLRITGKTDLTQLVPSSDSGFEEVPFNRAAPSSVVTVNLEGDFYFAAVENLEYELLRCLTQKTEVVVLRMKRLRAAGSTAMTILEHFWTILGEKGIRLVISGLEDELKAVMTSSGLLEKLGQQNIFYADNKLFQSTELAHARAWSIVKSQHNRAGLAPDSVSASEPFSITAADIMSTRAIRFGNEHQLREAMWLVSEMQKRMARPTAQPLFLQDREGKLAGELSMWAQLEQLSKGLSPPGAAEVDDQQLGALFRRHLTRSIGTLANTKLQRQIKSTSLAALMQLSVQSGMHVLPISDDDARLAGLVDQMDLLTGLGLALDVAPVRAAAPEGTESDD